VGQLDAIEQHGELGGIEAGAEGSLVERREAKAAPLETLVEDDEAAAVPGQHLHPVPAAGDENEEVAGVDVLVPPGADKVGQAVDALAKIDSLGGEKNANGSREKEHRP